MFRKVFTFIIIMAIAVTSVVAFPVPADITSAAGDTYQNPIIVPNQWTAPNSRLYGIGDPYILKYNGTYYLYASTQDSRWGFRIWESKDLVNWTWKADSNPQTAGGGLREDDSISAFQGAYAPEVYYRGGKFWLLTSRDQRNQRVYVSDTPWGPFTYKYQYPFPGVGNEIDGHIFIDDNGTKYFFSATGSKIRRATVTDSGDDLFKNVGGSGELNDLTVSNRWTEAPTVFKRKDMYYMTYCGNHVISPTYRIEYGMGASVSAIRESSVGGDNMLLCSTDQNFTGPVITGGGTTITATEEEKTLVGLGHNGIVVGPDLDTYYMAYHNLAGDYGVGPYRNYNLDRMVFTDDGRMSVLGPTTWAQAVPARPDAEYMPGVDDESDFFFGAGAGTFSKEITADDYTVEMNFVPSTIGTSKIYFSCKELITAETVMIDPVSRKISYDGIEKPLTADFKFDVLHTIMIKKVGTEIRVFLDGQQFFKRISSEDIGGGYIGYGGYVGAGGEITAIGYTAISSVVYGNKDGDVRFPTDAKIPAERAYESNAANFRAFVTGDSASYLINKNRDGLHSVNLNVKSAQTAMVRVETQHGSDEPIEVGRLAVGNTLNKYQQHTLRGVMMGAGVDKVIVSCIVGNVDFKDISVFKDETPAAAAGGFGDMNKILGAWTKSNGNQTMETTTQSSYNIAQMGTEWWSDYTVSAKVRCTAGSDAGFLLRARYLNDTPEKNLGANGDLDYHYGYYISADNQRVKIAKQKFQWFGWLRESGVKAIDITQDHVLTAKMVGPHIQVWLDGELRLDFVDQDDPILNGKVALRSNNTKAYFEDFSVTPEGNEAIVLPEFPHTLANSLVALHMATGKNKNGLLIYSAATSLSKEDKSKITAGDALQVLKNWLSL